MASPPTITAVRPGKRVKFGAHKMLDACTAMPAFAKNPYLIDKI